MATLKQQTAFNKVLENAQQGNPKSAKQILTESGYHKIANQAVRIFRSRGFQELLKEIDDEVILSRIYKILQDDDKRSSLVAADMLLKLKDRYPAGKFKISAFQSRDSVMEQNGEETV